MSRPRGRATKVSTTIAGHYRRESALSADQEAGGVNYDLAAIVTDEIGIHRGACNERINP